MKDWKGWLDHLYPVPTSPTPCLWQPQIWSLFELMFSFPLDKYPEVKLLDCMIALFLTFWGISILFSTVVVLTYIPTNSAQGIPFCHILANTCYLLLLIIASHSCEVMFHCGFDLQLSGDYCSASLHVPICHLYVFGKIPLQVLCSFKNYF